MVTFFGLALGQYEDYEDDYEENPLENMPFYLVEEAALELCELDKLKERLGLGGGDEYTDESLGKIKGDPVMQTCTERYGEFTGDNVS